MLTNEELDKTIGEHLTKFGALIRTDTFLDVEFKTTVGTNGTVAAQEVWRVPTGWDAWLHRVAVTADGYTPGSPLTTSGAWLALWRDTDSPLGFIVGLPASGNAVLPVTLTEGRGSAKVLRNGQTLIVSGSLGTLSAAIGLYITMQVRLEKSASSAGRELATAG